MTPEERAKNACQLFETLERGHATVNRDRFTKIVTDAIREAVAEQLERDCAAVCEFCRQPEKYSPAEFVDHGDHWLHTRSTNHSTAWCQAAAIRASASIAFPSDRIRARGQA